MAEIVAHQWCGVIILADLNTLFLCIVVEIRNSFSAWEAYAGLFFFSRCTKVGTGRIHSAVLTL